MGKRNPNGYGSVVKLQGNRSRPWMVRVTVYDDQANARQVPVAYAESEEQANILLAQYNNNPWNVKRETVTLIQLYQQWFDVRLPKIGRSSKASLTAAFKYCQKYYGVKYRSIRAYQMQDTIDSCPRGYSTQSAIKTLWMHLDKFAFELDIIDKMYSQLISAPPMPETTRQPFTQDQIDSLWKIQDRPWVDSALMYLYSGFRLNELLDMKCDQVNTTDWYFTGGEKTASGKDRIVPIHDRIKPLVQNRLGGEYLIMDDGKKLTPTRYYTHWNKVMEMIGADKTPHEARHTFETMLDNAHGNRKCIDMLMGHKSKDIGNRVYNHKTIEQLRETVNLLK